jgi:hypothetical protein
LRRSVAALRGAWQLLTAVAAAATVVSCGDIEVTAGTPPVRPPAGCQVATAPVAREQALQAAANCVAETLRLRHPSPYERISQADFDTRLARLLSDSTRMTDGQFTVGLMAFVAALGDGHTVVFGPNWRRLDVGFERFPEGIYVVQAGSASASLLGRRIVQIGGRSIDDVRQMVAALSPHENEYTVAAREAGLLQMVEVLQGLGLAGEDGSVTLVTERGDGGQESAVVGPHTPGAALVSFPALLPRSLQKRNLNYWWEFDAARRTIYFQYNVCGERADLPMAKVAADIDALLASGSATRMIVDLRFNGGGNSAAIDPLSAVLLRWDGSRDPERLAMLISARTYSSALKNALTLKYSTAARTFGETVGGNADNNFGEVLRQSIPYSTLSLQYSTRRFVFPVPRTFAPDRPVAWDWGSYRAGRDPALEAAGL